MSDLLPEQRRSQILKKLNHKGVLRVTDLTEQLGVAPITVRRDIDHLAEQGLLRRVRGGAACLTPSESGQAADSMRDRSEIGVVVPSLGYYWPNVVEAMQQEARVRGMRLLLREALGPNGELSQVEHLLRGEVGGLILVPDRAEEHTIVLAQRLAGIGIPLVLMERSLGAAADQLLVDSVRTDHRRGAGMAVRHLTRLGHQRIGLVTTLYSPHTDRIGEGFDVALADTGAAPGIQRRSMDQLSEADIASILEECRDTGTTALLVHADRDAIAIAQQCQARGIELGADLSIVSYDDEVAGLFSIPLTAVRPPRSTIGRTAVTLLANRLREPDAPAFAVQLTPSLTVRDSSKPPRAPGPRR